MYCQRCRSPLKVDKSLEDLNPAAFDLLVGATGASLKDQTPPKPHYPHERKELHDQAAAHGQAPVFKRAIPAPRLAQKPGSKENPAMSFVMLTDSQVVTPSISSVVDGSRGAKPRGHSQQHGAANGERRSQAHQMETTARLFEILSARSDVDHPICVECTDLLVEGLQKRLDSATKERDAYVGFLKRVNAEVPTEEEKQKVEYELAAAQQQEKAAMDELRQLEREKSAVDAEMASLEAEAQKLDLEEERFWRERNAFALTLSEFQNERDGVNLQYDHDSRQLERLQRTNVYNDTFCIGHDGFFGTINGLRLGRLANQAIEWAEINAAWGQTLLLLATVAEKLGFSFDGYRLRPMGSTSRIEKVEHLPDATGTPQPALPKVSQLELFSSGDLPLGRMFLHRRFDIAMVAFLDCLAQLGAFVEHGPGTPSRRPGPPPGPAQAQAQAQGLRLPYEIRRDRIGDASIKLGFNQDEAWTRACKYTLTCCKFLLAHASNVGGSGRRSAGAA
ncbi:MAG: autophagy protein 6 [Thelocarpon impressellum]|nr:MAG: autophagy protein 6 [Thelocarpon impressellum]